MEKKNIYILVIIGILAVASIYYLSRKLTSNESGSQNVVNGESSGSNQDTNLYPLGNQSRFWDEALSPFKDEEVKSYLELIEELRTGKINFVWEIWALRRKCAPDYTAEQCNSTLLAFIDKNYESPTKEKMRELFEGYFKYEVAMHKLEISADVKFEDRYEIIQKKRREILGNEKADLIFGMEEAQIGFMEGSANFIKTSKNMSPDERVRKYEELKKKNYGSYYESVVGREDKYEHYQNEIALREKEFSSNLSPEEKEKKIASLEIKYFGKDKAQELSKQRKEEESAKGKVTDYEKQERDFLSANASLSQKDKDKKLKEIRTKLLGEEEADAYQRRKQLEAETEK